MAFAPFFEIWMQKRLTSVKRTELMDTKVIMTAERIANVVGSKLNFKKVLILPN